MQLNENGGFNFVGAQIGNDIEEAKIEDEEGTDLNANQRYLKKKREAKILDLTRQKLVEEFGSEINICDSQCSQCEHHNPVEFIDNQ